MVGWAGIPWRDELRVIQVIGPREAIVEMRHLGRTVSVPDGKSVRVVPGQQTVEKLWLETEDTSRWTDDSVVSFTQPIVIIGTKRYSTVAGGSLTVLHGRILAMKDMERLKELVTERLKQTPR